MSADQRLSRRHVLRGTATVLGAGAIGGAGFWYTSTSAAAVSVASLSWGAGSTGVKTHDGSIQDFTLTPSIDFEWDGLDTPADGARVTLSIADASGTTTSLPDGGQTVVEFDVRDGVAETHGSVTGASVSDDAAHDSDTVSIFDRTDLMDDDVNAKSAGNGASVTSAFDLTLEVSLFAEVDGTRKTLVTDTTSDELTLTVTNADVGAAGGGQANPGADGGGQEVTN